MTRDSAEFSAAVLVGAMAGAALALSLRPSGTSRSRGRGRLLLPRSRRSRLPWASGETREGSGETREALAGAFLSALSRATSRGSHSEPTPPRTGRYLERAQEALAGIRERASAHLPSHTSPGER